MQTPSPSDLEQMGADMKQKAASSYCGSMMPFRNDGVAVAMKYVDTSGASVFELRVTPQDC